MLVNPKDAEDSCSKSYLQVLLFIYDLQAYMGLTCYIEHSILPVNIS